jgi:hypothetical protein
MPYTTEIDDVPSGSVAQVVKDFKDAGAKSVTDTQQLDNNYTVIAIFD